MSDPRPNLDSVRTRYQVPDDEMIAYRPRAFGAVDIPFTHFTASTWMHSNNVKRTTPTTK